MSRDRRTNAEMFIFVQEITRVTTASKYVETSAEEENLKKCELENVCVNRKINKLKKINKF